MEDKEKLNRILQYVWDRSHEDPNTQVYLHEVLCDLLRMVEGEPLPNEETVNNGDHN